MRLRGVLSQQNEIKNVETGKGVRGRVWESENLLSCSRKMSLWHLVAHIVGWHYKSFTFKIHFLCRIDAWLPLYSGQSNVTHGYKTVTRET